MTQAALLAGWGLQATLQPLGEGRINDTWRLSDQPELVLQRINGRVFTKPVEVMRSVARVVAHLQSVQPGWVPQLVSTSEGEPFYVHSDDVFRVWRYVEGEHIPPDAPPELLHRAGWAYGRTQKLLSTLPGPRLPDAIDGFMRLDRYLEAFDAQNTSSLGHEVVSAVDSGRELAHRLGQPTGYIHADCKLGNLLISATGEVAAVLDLDTVMWGHWAWDFGDLVRSAFSINGGLSLAHFDALASGFLDGSGERREPDLLMEAPRYVTLMLAVRYLTDHLRGDVFFKVEQHGDNLQRGLAQLRLVAELTERAEDLRRIAQRVVNTIES